MSVTLRFVACLLMIAWVHTAQAAKRLQRIFIDGGYSSYCLDTDSSGDIWMTNAAGWITRVDDDTLEPTTVVSDLKNDLGGGVGFTLGIAIDPEDNVYFVHGDNLWKLWKSPPEGTQCNVNVTTACVTRAVKKNVHRSRTLWPVYMGPGNNIYTAGVQVDAEGLNPRVAVFRVSPEGVVDVFAAPSGTAVEGSPYDLAVDANGNMFVSAASNLPESDDIIHRFAPSESPVHQTIDAEEGLIQGLEVDGSGRLYVAGHALWRIETSVPGNWSGANLTTTRLSPQTGFSPVNNSYMQSVPYWDESGIGSHETLFTTGMNGHTWKYDVETETLTKLFDRSQGPPYFDYGMDVIEDAGYLYLSTEETYSGPTLEVLEPSALWRYCENFDTDMRCDDRDNCLQVDNAETGDPSFQLDPDHDGYGSACDADLDQSGVASLADYGIFLGCFARTVGAGVGPPDDPTCAESDLNGDGVVGLTDYGRLQALLFAPVGPSGVSCTTSPPTDGSCP